MKVKKCVIPLAGLGTRMYPFTKVIPKVFLPVVDRDGFVKPALHLILIEAADSGVEEICLVVQPGQDEMIRRYLFEPSPPKIAGEIQVVEIEEERRRLGHLVRFAFQNEPRGFGHAVYCAREFVGGDPFVVSLGDHLYRSRSTRRCIAQVMETFERYSLSITGLTIVGEDQVQSVGVVSGRFLPDDDRVLRLERLVEKPALSYARDHLRIGGVRGYLGNFGIDLLTPSIFDILEGMIARTPLDREIQLRDAMDELIRSEGMLGYIVEGERFDIGSPAEYLKTLIQWSGPL
jgi:UTP--glucose-1-phosphate uridylyltransferase